MNYYYNVLERFENSSVYDSFYCMQKADGSCAIYTQSDRDAWANNYPDALQYYYNQETQTEWDLIENIAAQAACHIDDTVQSDLLEKRQFKLYPFSHQGPVFETQATALDIANYFFYFFMQLNLKSATEPSQKVQDFRSDPTAVFRLTMADCTCIWDEPGFFAIAAILQIRCKNLPEAKEALTLMQSIVMNGFSDEKSPSTTKRFCNYSPGGFQAT
jgi:hypothetical protein